MAKQEATQPQQAQAQGQAQQAQQAPAERRQGEQQGLARREPFPPSLWAASPFEIIDRITDEMERAFEDFGFGRGWIAPRFGRGRLAPRFGRELWPRGEMERAMWTPQIETFEREGQLVVRADLPGLTKDDVRVEVTENALTIQGERRQEREEERGGYYRSECSYGKFYRSIPLPEGVNAEQAKASFRDGVLEITVPAPQLAQQRRQIEIK
jgi:HSP20 family protein